MPFQAIGMLRTQKDVASVNVDVSQSVNSRRQRPEPAPSLAKQINVVTGLHITSQSARKRFHEESVRIYHV